MKVAYFTESLPPNKDGVTKTLCRLVDTLESEKIEYKFYSPVKPDESVEWTRKVRKVPSVPFALYDYYRMGLPYFEGIFQELDAFRPDLVHIVSQTLLGCYGLKYAHKRRLPIVSSYHTHFVQYMSYYGLDMLADVGWHYLRWFHNQCQCTYAPSPSTVAELQNEGIGSVELWQRGIELDLFSPEKRSDALRNSVTSSGEPILLFVGRLVREKDLNDLIDANQLLKERGFRFKQVIIGDGPMRQELEQELPDAHFTGFLAGEELAVWYASSDLFVFPSTTETFGNVILEAFASGIPAVGVDKGGVADIITSGVDGMIALANNPGDFAEKIAFFLKDSNMSRHFGRDARFTAQKYRWDTINRKLLESYQQVISRN
ncbi:glycosyltransferase family 1 protein [bacterium]|nr:glycosyltransferase family 1 protein [bacterium]